MSIIFRKCCIQGDDIPTPVTTENNQGSTIGIDVISTPVTSVDVTASDTSTPAEKEVPIEPSNQVDGTRNGNHISK